MSPGATSDDLQPAAPEDWTADWLLASWAKVIERLDTEYPDFGLGVTLNVGGAIYSGVLVSGRRWMDDMVTVLRTKSIDPRIGSALAESFEEEKERYRRPEFVIGPVRFLHLLHASLVDTRGERTGEGLSMRFRLDSVAAWAIAGWAVGSTNWTSPEPGFTY
jgi:hypothetical protein